MYKVIYHQLVKKEDLSGIPKTDLEQIFKAIQKKLCRAPKEFGKPLKKSLKGLMRLRIGKYRVVYQVQDKDVLVWVIKIGLRRNSEVYIEASKRLF